MCCAYNKNVMKNYLKYLINAPTLIQLQQFFKKLTIKYIGSTCKNIDLIVNLKIKKKVR
jgi:hypothetical protein